MEKYSLILERGEFQDWVSANRLSLLVSGGCSFLSSPKTSERRCSVENDRRDRAVERVSEDEFLICGSASA